MLSVTLGEPHDLSFLDGEEPASAVVLLERGSSAAPGQIDAVLSALAAAADENTVVVTTRPMIDTLKVVDADGTVAGTADREHHRFVTTPIAVRVGLLRRAPQAAAAVTPAEALTLLASGSPAVIMQSCAARS